MGDLQLPGASTINNDTETGVRILVRGGAPKHVGVTRAIPLTGRHNRNIFENLTILILFQFIICITLLCYYPALLSKRTFLLYVFSKLKSSSNIYLLKKRICKIRKHKLHLFLKTTFILPSQILIAIGYAKPDDDNGF